ncbi:MULTISPECIES: DNA mismatch repair endonuclease MutL [Romboutsia]|uniref:DNA mismatch repair protein MutL n=1 Tax=Romboutsia hominis TaxID=1507512 RepID=A0A2P2BVP5_9FIRM|nr:MULTISPECIES: DNA mismatch repair endonuclease MutL [Romboutsia]MCH1960432.1 DNA mismatch repair endonuclease MutL [Romboutsia hominis]MCH1969137.1 DNA mismatch repair endonuclease MutL [Romboutsia hominis]MDB8791472.1 DNA mismatch repair endonuclease MutL [Romboutsia sp. 1001216sp1]MDB8802443.1 DNA mismatch repair endonuclease MutL [Romboutsia sp. 1001216sp1]MDB8805950.1 DNA mismatch repair endonuclease MutL [Romboutsia sp. 1001216sp1]
MNRINILDDLTINKIAAGEVVERPSSVVKELVENSIDAGSTKVIVEIIDGGKKLIRITDNGCGIASSEVDKSFLRHATSKIEKIDDLYDLYSLGFRGEALASISAVSKLEMITKTKEESIGTKVIVEGGKIISKEPVGCSNGTTIIIKDIFFNTPARQKFLKSNHAETINISDLINKLAIGNPNIQFKYINNNKPMLNTPGDNRLISAIRSIYGKDVCENLVKLKYKSDNFEIKGYVGDNNVYRSNKNLQHIYINNRFVKSKIILDAINEAYKGIIPINKHAVCFLDIKINPGSIDVNIHPTKLEVKFENEKEVYIELRDLIRRTLLNNHLIGKYEASDSINNLDKINAVDNKSSILNKKEGKVNLDDIAMDKIEVVELDSQKPIDNFLGLDDVLKSKTSNDKNINVSHENKNILYNEESTKEDVIKENTPKIYIDDDIKLTKDSNNEFLIEGKINLDKTFSIEEISKLDEDKNDSLQKSLENNILNTTNINDLSITSDSESIQEGFFKEEKSKFSLSEYKVLGTIFDTYIVMSKGNSMYLLDQHAAHEKVLYERYMDKFYKSDISMQMLLDPIILELSNVDMLQVEKNLELFMKFGFEIEIFGNNHIMIRCVPTVFGVPESEKFILQIIDNIEDINNNYELKGEKFASMACRSAIKANDKIKNVEINSLFSQMEACENPFTCPHGRPVLVEISKKEIEKMFKRIM